MPQAYEKFILRNHIRVERIVNSTEKQVGDLGTFVKEEVDVFWVATYDAPVYYRASPGRTGRPLEYTNAEFSAEGDTYDAAVAAIAKVASEQGWDIQ